MVAAQSSRGHERWFLLSLILILAFGPSGGVMIGMKVTLTSILIWNDNSVLHNSIHLVLREVFLKLIEVSVIEVDNLAQIK